MHADGMHADGMHAYGMHVMAALCCLSLADVGLHVELPCCMRVGNKLLVLVACSAREILLSECDVLVEHR